MKTINLSVEQIRSLAYIMNKDKYFTEEQTIHGIIFKLSEYLRSSGVAIAVPVESASDLPKRGSAPPLPQSLTANSELVAMRGDPQPFSENESLMIDEALMSLGLAAMELRKDRDHEKITGGSFLQAFKNMRDLQKNRVWEIVRGCIGYTEEQRELALIVEFCQESELPSDTFRYKRCLVDRLVSEGRIFAARTETSPEGKTVSWYRAKVA